MLSRFNTYKLNQSVRVSTAKDLMRPRLRGKTISSHIDDDYAAAASTTIGLGTSTGLQLKRAHRGSQARGSVSITQQSQVSSPMIKGKIVVDENE